MSFNTPYKDDLEAGDDLSVHYIDYPEFGPLSKAIDQTLHDISHTQLATIRALLQEYEGLQRSDPDRAGEVSKKISTLCAACTDSFKTAKQKTQELDSYLNSYQDRTGDEDLKYLRQKEMISVNMIKNSLQVFQKLQKKYEALEKQYVADVSHLASPESATAEQQQQQQQVQITYEPINAEELEQLTLLIEEREREIQQITHDTQEINDIFLSLQDIVHEQQFQIDSIEDNILSYSTDARGAMREFHKAERYQKRAGGRMLCCLLILVGVFGSVILIGLIF